MRRFDTPAAPPGWVGMGAELLRIVDPTGRAIAWLAPGFGANCVGYAVRQDGPAPGSWRHLFRSGGPRDLRINPRDYGCAVLGPEAEGEGSAHLTAWRFVERDPTAAVCAARCGAIRLELTARLEDAALQLALLATNEGTDAAILAPGLRLCFARGVACDLSLGFGGQAVATGGDAPGARVSVASAAGEGYRWGSFRLPGGGVAVEAWSMGASRATIAPGGQVRLGLAVAPV